MAEQKINDEAKNCDQKSESTKTEIICIVLVFALCCLIAFNAESSLGFWGRLLSAAYSAQNKHLDRFRLNTLTASN